MTPLPSPLNDVFASWSQTAAATALQCRGLFLDAAARLETGPLEESLKWGQPAWRPSRPRTGSTLRMGWDAAEPDALTLFVDCKTDLAARMQETYPTLMAHDGRRRMGVSLNTPLPEQAIAHLAEMTFSYHRAKRSG